MQKKKYSQPISLIIDLHTEEMILANSNIENAPPSYSQGEDDWFNDDMDNADQNSFWK